MLTSVQCSPLILPMVVAIFILVALFVTMSLAVTVQLIRAIARQEARDIARVGGEGARAAGAPGEIGGPDRPI